MEATTGAQIKKFRIARKMTQAELAGKIGCATITIRQYENNSRTPGIVTMKKLAFALKCRIEDLMGLETFDTGEELMSRIKEIDESSGGESLTVIHTTDPRKFINFALDQMNEEGQVQVAKRAEEVLEVPKYRKSTPKD